VELPDNILRHYLRNVYFIAGGMCGGKTTIASYLACKHGLTLYNWDEMYPQHKAISDPQCQPEMHRHGFGGDWEAHFSRRAGEWAASLGRSIREQVDIAVVDLVHRARDGRIIVDGVFPHEVLERISVPQRCVFLYATMEVIRRDHFRRHDKQDMLECIMRLRDPEEARQNVFRASELVYVKDMKRVKESPFTSYVRDIGTDDEQLRRDVEQHFGFG